MTQNPRSTLQLILSPVVIVSALGYFVDVFDIILFSVVRVTSLKDLGLVGDEITTNGAFLINCQMIGMLLGGILWGILGDKIGRVKVLFGSILLYSLANIFNAFVQSIDSYAFWRFIAGVGLAGEIGAGITLVAESLPQKIRSLGTTIVATVGVLGAVMAGFIGDYLPWRYSYIIGGALGIVLLALRVSVHESGLYAEVAKRENVRCGDLPLLFSSRKRIFRYAQCILVGLPTWFIVGILMTFSPEISKELDAPEIPKVGMVIVWCYTGLFLGDALSGVLSQVLQSRRKVLLLFLLVGIFSSASLLLQNAPSIVTLYGAYLLIGISAGYWVLTLTTAAEHFGTNLRATVTTTVPNFIRGALVPMTTLFAYLKPEYGAIGSAQIVGALTFVLAIAALYFLQETYHRNLDFTEE